MSSQQETPVEYTRIHLSYLPNFKFSSAFSRKIEELIAETNYVLADYDYKKEKKSGDLFFDKIDDDEEIDNLKKLLQGIGENVKVADYEENKPRARSSRGRSKERDEDKKERGIFDRRSKSPRNSRSPKRNRHSPSRKNVVVVIREGRNNSPNRRRNYRNNSPNGRNNSPNRRRNNYRQNTSNKKEEDFAFEEQ